MRSAPSWQTLATRCCSIKGPHNTPPHPSHPCRDAEHGEREGDPRPRYAEQLAAGWVDYVRLDTPQSVYTALNKLWAHQPVLLRGTPLAAGLLGRWSFQQLVRPLGGGATDTRLSSSCSAWLPCAQPCTCRTATAAPLPLDCLQAAAIGGEQQLIVLCSDARRNRFFEYDDAKNVYGG